MIEAVLFDLDGTILKHRVEDFLSRYFASIQKKFNWLFPEGELVKLILASTEKMMANEGSKTNKEAFWEDFLSRVPYTFEELEPLFQKFYLEDFPSLSRPSQADPEVRKVLEELRERGYKLALATNPLFPLIAVEERLRWAGVESKKFDFVASYEVMHYSKPNPGFFKEIASFLGVRPESCLMVGNEVELDLIPASQIGMRTFLVKNGYEVLTKGDFKPDFEGSLSLLPDLLENRKEG
jgi:FMN phosphatase YigB (HAD superfamily)